MNFRAHLLIGFVIVLALAVQRDAPRQAVAAGSFFALVGAVLPDIDHPLSYVRRVFNYALFGAVFITLALSLSTPEIRPLLRPLCGDYCGIWFVPPLIAAVASAAVVILVAKIMPPHRGPLHSFLAVIVFGALAAAIASVSGTGSAVLVGCAAATGYASHIISDFFLRG